MGRVIFKCKKELRGRSAVAALLFVVATVAGAAGRSEPELFEPLGYAVTTGAAAGYLADEACATCHADLYETYQQVGMARSFMRPREERLIEDLSAEPFFHEASGRYYEMRWKNDRLAFRRYQLDDEQQETNVLEKKVDWIVGSGNKTRSYLYRTPSGELFQLPVAWYSESGEWGMAPGYDASDHEGVQRQVQRECMFCHNAYPDVPAGSDTHWMRHVFPETLPEGIGCQRCHGPGAEHVRSVLRGDGREAITAAIVNPARLSVEERDSVCYQCHLLPSVSMIGVRRFDRPDYSFRPGEPLSDYMLHVEIDDDRMPREERFEINHHGYRLRQSPCFIESEGALTCITCHDPHRKIPEEDRISHYGSICLGCHDTHDVAEEDVAIEADDCMSCHMPQRRTQDVVHVVMTDHRIQRRADRSELLAPLDETQPSLRGIEFLIPKSSPAGLEGEIYKTVTALRTVVLQPLASRLEGLLEQAPTDQVGAYFDLAMAQIKMKKNQEAEQTLSALLEHQPDHPRILQWLGIAAMGQGELDRAEAHFRRGLELDPRSAELHFNLGLLLISRERDEEARAHLKHAVAARPHMAVAWFYLGESYAREGVYDAAVASHRHALTSDPSFTRSQVALAEALAAKAECGAGLRPDVECRPGSESR